MENYCLKLGDTISEIQRNEEIKVYIVSSIELERIRPGTLNGCFDPIFNDGEYTEFRIFIDNELSCEGKLSVLFHEMGHLKLSRDNGYKIVEAQLQENQETWRSYSEYKAYENQITESIQLFENGFQLVLEFTLEQINYALINPNIAQYYKNAIRRIQSEAIWETANSLVRSRR